MSNETIFQSLWDETMSTRGHFSVDRHNDTVNLVGLQTGKVTAVSAKPNAVLGGTVVVLHIEGSSYFVGRGIQGYAGAEYLTILVEREPRSVGGKQASYRYVALSQAFEAKSNATIRTTQTSLTIDKLEGALQS